jgi:hypothetical protein
VSVSLRGILILLVVFLAALAAAQATAQHARKAPTGQIDRAVVGLPVFSSDGERIGKVLAIGTDDDDRTVLVAEIERPLGIGTDPVAIPPDMFKRRSNRIELTITAAEVNERISGTGRDR